MRFHDPVWRPGVGTLVSCFLFAFCGTPSAGGNNENAPSEVQLAEVQTGTIDPTGLWRWEQRFGSRKFQRAVTLTLSDGAIEGTYGNPDLSDEERRQTYDGMVAIAKGKLVGDKISFDVTRRFGRREFTTTFSGVIVGNEIAGMSSVAFGGRTRESPWMATRVDPAAQQTQSRESGDSETEGEDDGRQTEEIKSQSE